MNNYKVSICVPIYGVEKYIKRCVYSLFKQTYTNIEYIFVNDATKDRSVAFLKEVLNEFANRAIDVRIITHNSNKGLAAARNTAVAEATGEFILHVDSDDYLDDNAVELLVLKQLESDADIVSADAIAYYPKYQERITYPHFSSSKQMAIDILNGNCNTYIWGKLIRRSLYIDNQIEVKEGLNMGEDLQITAVLAYYAKKVSNLSFPIYHYECSNINAYTKSYSKDKRRENEASYQILCDFFKEKGCDYVDAINISNIRRLVGSIITVCMVGDKESFEELLIRKNNIPKVYWKYVSVPKRIILYMNSFSFIRTYVLIVRKIRHIIK